MAKQPDRLLVTVSDPTTGDVLGYQAIYDDYVLICAGHAYLAHTQVYANGTHVLTIKNAGAHAAATMREDGT